MKKIYTLFICFICLIACQPDKSKAQEKNQNPDSTGQETQKLHEKQNLSPEERIKGYWVGMFGENKINIALTELLADGLVKGYSLVSGNERAFSGIYKKEGNVFSFDVKEPGNDVYDGHFEFNIDLSQRETDTTGIELKGKWTPFDKKLPLKTYSLTKREFRFNAEAGNYPETSKRLLKSEDIENMFKEDLRLMRNEIYARHGYSFKLKEIRKHFDQQDWYIPVTTDIRNKLTEIETKNAELIKRYEQYATEFYDEFGR